ncbi:hypothetical protein [Lichenicoccus sp.]|uniref:hypothetical protein n=1 Tax=Lichenicoccus sp. TaxID=2781899 RepID=UPI003D09BEE6
MKTNRRLPAALMSLLVSTAAFAQGAPATAPKIPPSQRLKTSKGIQNDQISPTPAAPGSTTDHTKKPQKTKPPS